MHTTPLHNDATRVYHQADTLDEVRRLADVDVTNELRARADGSKPLASLPDSVIANGLALFAWSEHRALRTWLDTCRRGLPAYKVRDLLAALVAALDELGV